MSSLSSEKTTTLFCLLCMCERCAELSSSKKRASLPFRRGQLFQLSKVFQDLKDSIEDFTIPTITASLYQKLRHGGEGHVTAKVGALTFY